MPRSLRRAHPILIALILLALAGLSPVSAGIIELGHKGQLAGGSTFQVIVDGHTFSEGTHSPGDDAATIASKVAANIDASPLYTATIADPNNNPTLITVLRQSGGDPVTVTVFIQDPNIGGTFLDQSASPGLSATLNGVDAVAGNGNFEVDITYICEGMPPTLDTQVIPTAGKSAGQVNAAMVAALQANGFIVVGPPNGPWTITQPNSRIQKIQMERTDTGIQVSGVGMSSAVTAFSSIPTLTGWGLAALAGLIALAALFLLRG